MNFANLKSNIVQYLLIAPSLSLYFIIVEKIVNCNKSEGLSMVYAKNIFSIQQFKIKAYY
jgi:hypothetical protein